MNLSDYVKRLEYVHPIIKRGLDLLGFAIIPTALLLSMNWGAVLGALFIAGKITLGTYNSMKRGEEENSFCLIATKNVSNTIEKAGILCLGAAPWIFDAFIDSEWETAQLILASEVPLAGLGMMINRKKYLNLYNDAIEYSEWEAETVIYWSEVYRVVILPDQLKLFYEKADFLIIEHKWLSEDQLTLVYNKLNQEINKRQIHTLKETADGKIEQEINAHNEKVNIWE